ncbi:MAG: ribonuclease HII [Pseudomonadota bacterium]
MTEDRKPKREIGGDGGSAWLDGLPEPVAGIDEVGRGPWAGPIVAAAVMLRSIRPDGLADSKVLSARRRVALDREIRAQASVAVAVVAASEIDRIGLTAANDAAMLRAAAELEASEGPIGSLAVDGRRIPQGCRWPARAVIGGDGRVAAIAAASIVAKVARDRLMEELDARHPGYGWSTNRGYGTAAHASALAALGPSPEHRRCFAPVAAALASNPDPIGSTGISARTASGDTVKRRG